MPVGKPFPIFREIVAADFAMAVARTVIIVIILRLDENDAAIRLPVAVPGAAVKLRKVVPPDVGVAVFLNLDDEVVGWRRRRSLRHCD
jgi:hypothetical protein